MIAMVIPGDIGSLKAKEVYQTTYITRNYHGNAVKLKISIRLPISHYHGNAVKHIGSLIDFFSFTALSW
jgi:hypothetical protein